MKKLILSLSVIILLQACTRAPMTQHDTNFDLNDLTYFKDARTGICFASVGTYIRGYTALSITAVDCNKAASLIKQ